MFEERNEKRNWKFLVGAVVLVLVVSLAAGAFGGALTGGGQQVLRGGSQAVHMPGGASLGNAITDNVYVYGQMRSYDGSDNWADVSDVSALGRGNGWHASYYVTGWGSASQMQALFANTQVATTTVSGKTAYGIEGKATFSSGTASEGTGIGVFGKMTVKTTSTELAAGYPFYSLIDVNNSAVITTSASYYAELSGESTLGTVSVLQTKASDTWDYGVNFNGSTMTSDIVLQNGETIDNATDGVVKTDGEWGYKQYVIDKTASYTVTAAESGAVFTNDGAGDTITFTLPTPAEGLIYTFLEQDNHLILIDPSSTEVINYSGALAGEYLTSSAQYDSITIYSDGTDWFVKSIIGTWADE